MSELLDRFRARRAGRTKRVRFATPPSAGFVALYVILVAVTVGAVALYLAFPESGFINDFAPELSTSTLAILITLVFVQRLLERQEWRRRLRGSIGGLRSGARVLARLQAAWATVLKGCLPAAPVERRESTAGLFIDVRTEELMYLDPGAPLLPVGQPALAWLTAEIEAACDSVRTLARQYAGGFDVEYLEALEELIDDPFIEIVTGFAGAPVSAREWRVRINSARGARARHFDQLLRVIDLHNEIAAEAARIRSSLPRTRELGIDLAPDHDLRVDTTLTDAWWRSTPRPGSLRELRRPDRATVDPVS